MLLQQWMLNLLNSKLKKGGLISFLLNSDFLKEFSFSPQKLCIRCALECYWYWKYNFIICVLGIAGIKVSNNRRLVTPLFHTPLQFLIMPEDAGCHGSLKPSDRASWQCCGVSVRRTAHTRLPQPSVLQEVNGTSPGDAGAGGGKPLWSKVMCRDWEFFGHIH